jgi:sodium/potassium-transporting ATPase subunit alpha
VHPIPQSKFPQLLPYILSFFLYLPAPLNALLILSIDIGTDLLPAISLAYEQVRAVLCRLGPGGSAWPMQCDAGANLGLLLP